MLKRSKVRKVIKITLTVLSHPYAGLRSFNAFSDFCSAININGVNIICPRPLIRLLIRFAEILKLAEPFGMAILKRIRSPGPCQAPDGKFPC